MQGLLGYQLRAFSWIPWWGSGSLNSQTGILPLLVAKDILYPKESGRGKRNKELCWEKLGQIRAEKPSSFLSTYLQKGEEAASGEEGKGEGGRWRKEAGGWRKKPSKYTGFLLLWLHFSFSPTLLFLHTLTSLKEKYQTFRIHTSKKSHCQLWFSTPQTPF